MQIVEQPDIFLREPTSEVKLPLTAQDQVIIVSALRCEQPKGGFLGKIVKVLFIITNMFGCITFLKVKLYAIVLFAYKREL